MTSVSHPDRATLESFMRGDLEGDLARGVVVHLLGDCPACRQVTAQTAPFSLGEVAGHSELPSDPTHLIAELRRAERQRQHDDVKAASLIAEIDPLPQARRLLVVKNSRRFHSRSLAELLLAESWASRFDDTTRTLELADLAVEVAERVAAELGDDAPRFVQADGRVKLSAAWLIEHCGFARGDGDGPVGLSCNHTLAGNHHRRYPGDSRTDGVGTRGRSVSPGA